MVGFVFHQGEAAASEVHAHGADEGDKEGAGHWEGGQGRGGGEVPRAAEGLGRAQACDGCGEWGAGQVGLLGSALGWV